MVGVETKQDVQPLKVLPGLNSRLELYPDRVVIARTDFFGKLLPEFVGAGQEIALADITGVFSRLMGRSSAFCLEQWV